MPSVTIVRRPSGEAPAWVRDAWVGVTVTVTSSVATTQPGYGVLTGPRTIPLSVDELIATRVEVMKGYMVLTLDAIAALEQNSPEAADWWRQNVSHLLQPGLTFVFDESACRFNAT